MTTPNAPAPDLSKLGEVRHGLLVLHKTLLETERLWYEREHGRLEGGGQLLQLLAYDPGFAWLRLLSMLIVQIDERMEDKDKPLTAAEVDKLLAEIRTLITTNQGDADFQRKYNQALQERPDVVIAQARVVRSLDR